MNNGKLHNDRTGGVRSKARVKPPVVSFSENFSPKTAEPKPLKKEELGKKAVACGFLDGDTEQSIQILETIGFQHARSYTDLFRDKTGKIEPTASMKALHRCILFDRKFQVILLEYIGIFELKFRAQYAYHLSTKKGSFAHRNKNNYKDLKYFAGFLEQYASEFNRQLKQRNHELLAAYQAYGDAPTWLAVEIMSFGTLSKLYNNTKSKEIRSSVANSFGATPEEFTSWTRAISSARNTCAHFGRLCGKNLVSKPKRIPTITADNSNPFYIVLLLAYMFRDFDLFEDDTTLSYGLNLFRDIAQLFIDFGDVIKRCGIPTNWIELIGSVLLSNSDLVIGDDFVNLDPTIGRVWFTVGKEDGTRIDIGRFKK